MRQLGLPLAAVRGLGFRMEVEEALSRLAIRDEESDSDEEEELVDLGFAQPPEHAWTLQRQHFPSKAGGAPAWLDPENLPSNADACCGFCEEPLQFLLQVYAPIEERDDTFHRALFVFMCLKMECLRKDQAEQKNHGSQKSIKVFRTQLARKNGFYSDHPPTGQSDRPLTTGAVLCNWCGTWRGEKLCGGCKHIRYCSRKHQIEHWRAGHSSACKSELSASTSGGIKILSSKLWRELQIVMDEEPSDEDADDQRTNPLQIVPVKQESDPLSKELQEFEEASKDDQCWAAFQTRIGRAPTQVLRYSRTTGSRPLWMRRDGQPAPQDISTCRHCGGPRIFEFQVLPQLLYYFQVENEVDSLDWGTIAVFSCARSCPIEGYTDELPWVQLSS